MMKPGFLFRLSVIVSALFVVGLQISAAAGFVPPADRLSIAEPRSSAEWKGQDLTVKYAYSADQGQMELSGNIRFADSLLSGLHAPARLSPERDISRSKRQSSRTKRTGNKSRRLRPHPF